MDQFRSATSGYSASVCSNRQNTMSDQGVDVDFEADYIDGDNEPPRKRGRTQQRTSEHCPYLAEISRKLLDFDFEKVCSVSLSNLNVYGCLVCGKYFQGTLLDIQVSINCCLIFCLYFSPMYLFRSRQAIARLHSLCAARPSRFHQSRIGQGVFASCAHVELSCIFTNVVF
jgi:hypothetical protein